MKRSEGIELSLPAWYNENGSPQGREAEVKLMLPVHPEYAGRIFDGSKTFEYRKRRMRAGAETLLVYVTAPLGMVAGEARIAGIVSGTPDEVWEQTHGGGGICRSAYDSYFKGCSEAFALRLEGAFRYSCPLPASAFGLRAAPQSAVYV